MNPKCRLNCGPSRSGKIAVVLHRRRLRVARARRLQQAGGAQHPRHQVERDVVEHDRDDDLVGAGARLEQPGDAGPERAADDAAERGRRAGGCPTAGRTRTPTQPATAAAMSIWPRPPMLNMPTRNASADAEAGRDERRREGQRLGERPDAASEVGAPEVVDRALEQRRVGAGDRRPRSRRACRRAGRRSSRLPPARSSSVNAIMMPPTRSASTTASTEMIALPRGDLVQDRCRARRRHVSRRRRRRSPARRRAARRRRRLLDRDVGVDSGRPPVERLRSSLMRQLLLAAVLAGHHEAEHVARACRRGRCRRCGRGT